jgi:hypothetical protein
MSRGRRGIGSQPPVARQWQHFFPSSTSTCSSTVEPVHHGQLID